MDKKIFFRQHRETPGIRRLRVTPAQDQARAGVTAFLASGRCVFSPTELATQAQISETTAHTFLAAGTKAGLFQLLDERIPSGTRSMYVVTEQYPGAPSAETITLSALALVASKTRPGSAAFAYHTALAIHGLTEVTSEGIHLIRVAASIKPPQLPADAEYIPKPRPPVVWMTLPDHRPVWLTARSASQLPSMDIVHVRREGLSLPITAPLRTLVDAWMHPDWCGGPDRVADAWRLYWRRPDSPAHIAELATLLVHTTWRGLWSPLTQWAARTTPRLESLPAVVEKAAIRRMT